MEATLIAEGSATLFGSILALSAMDRTTNGNERIRLTFFSTGTVQLRLSMKGQPIENDSIIMRRLRAFTDCKWSGELPIAVFVISHPKGPILFDTGESPQWNNIRYNPPWIPTTRLLKIKITPEDGVIIQLRRLGVEPKDLQAIVLSHLHGDHAGGLGDLAAEAPNVPIYVSREPWETFGKHPVFARLNGCNPQDWPKNFRPRLVEYSDPVVGPWKNSCNITPDGRIIAVDTSGHVPGHMSLIVHGDNDDRTLTTFLLAGDAAYDLDALEKEVPDGINSNPKRAYNSMRVIKEFAKQTDVVILASHDPNTPQMLEHRTIYKPKQ